MKYDTLRKAQTLAQLADIQEKLQLDVSKDVIEKINEKSLEIIKEI